MINNNKKHITKFIIKKMNKTSFSKKIIDTKETANINNLEMKPYFKS